MRTCVFTTPQRSPGNRSGAALVIILAFVVLLAGLIIAFFSLAMSERQISNSSASQVKVELFAQGAVDQIVGDLKQEIIDGSTITTTGSTSIYMPKTGMNAVPQLVGSSGTGGLENLVKRSAYGTRFSSSANASNRAANVNSATNPSFNNRYISAARWNKPLLIPTGTTSATDYTPVLTSGTFTAPDWILVGRDGSNPKAATTNPAAADYALGRYAYNIYDEGGLLDVNIAGYPLKGSPPYSSSNSDPQAAYKGVLAFADLTQLPGISAMNPASQMAVINSLVGWRNYASAQPAGSLSSGFDFTGLPLSNFTQAVLSNTTGFLKTSNTSMYDGGSGSATDRMFTSRQMLIRFLLQNIASSPSDAINLKTALQYLTHFSRDLNQPSFAPDPNRPKTKPGLQDYQGNANGGNDVNGQDDTFNPPFLSIRATSAFSRNDGSTAVVGEPLVKKRFALNRLAWLTYQGPSASRTMSDPDMQEFQNNAITQAFLQQGTADNIQKYFGLAWNTAGYWTYDHGIRGSSGNPIIGLLKGNPPAVPDSSGVQAANREPDFFELLKAGIACGSIAKGATNPSGNLDESSAYTYDTTTDYAILQIGANIIDQFDVAGYPTRIRINDGSRVVEIRGCKNLPYFYRVRNNMVISELASPVPATSSGGAGVPAFTITGANSMQVWTGVGVNTLTNTGHYSVFYQPEIWNPYDSHSSLGNPRPSNLRVIADAAPLDADGNPLTASYNTIGCRSQFFVTAGSGSLMPPGVTSGRHYFCNYSTPSTQEFDAAKTPSYYSAANPSATVSWQGNNTELTFGDNGGVLFREPTILTQPNIPEGSNLALGPNNLIRVLYTDPLLSSYWYSGTLGEGVKCLNDPYCVGYGTVSPQPKPFIGFYCGQGPIRWVMTKSGTSYIVPTNVAETIVSTPSGFHANTYRVQYYDGSNWITYDEKYAADLSTATVTLMLNNSAIVDTSLNSSIGSTRWATCSDPRSRRFGFLSNSGVSASVNAEVPCSYPLGSTIAGTTLPPKLTDSVTATTSFFIDRSNNVMMPDRWDATSGLGWKSSTNNSSLPSVGGWYPGISVWGMDSPTFYYRPGLLSQNNPEGISDGLPNRLQADSANPQYYTDPDGVARRAMGAFVPTSSSDPATSTIGLPMARIGGVSGVGGLVDPNQSQSRPIILNRPFRSVAELGYVFSGTPWKNLSMSTPESGAAALLDVFCIQADDNPNPIIAGKVNLNTRQAPVLQAILVGSYADEFGTVTAMPATEASAVANLLTTRTLGAAGPLTQITELVGKYNSSVAASLGGVDGSQSYTGFSADLSSLYTSGALANPTKNNIARFREAALRPLATVGQTRVWNLLIDIVAQTGRYPSSSTGLDQFVVEGEQRYWVHVAIDRFTGEVIDKQIEIIKE